MSSGKTNKSVAKRIKVTKRGKVMRRNSGHNHFNAKKSRAKQMDQKRWEVFDIKNKKLSELLPFDR